MEPPDAERVVRAVRDARSLGRRPVASLGAGGVIQWRARLALTGLVLGISLAGAAAALAADEVPIPKLALSTWKTQMITYGRKHCAALPSETGDSALATTYYDMIRVVYQIADYTGDPSWNACAIVAREVYRDKYVLVQQGPRARPLELHDGAADGLRAHARRDVQGGGDRPGEERRLRRGHRAARVDGFRRWQPGSGLRDPLVHQRGGARRAPPSPAGAARRSGVPPHEPVVRRTRLARPRGEAEAVFPVHGGAHRAQP